MKNTATDLCLKMLTVYSMPVLYGVEQFSLSLVEMVEYCKTKATQSTNQTELEVNEVKRGKVRASMV